MEGSNIFLINFKYFIYFLESEYNLKISNISYVEMFICKILKIFTKILTFL